MMILLCATLLAAGASDLLVQTSQVDALKDSILVDARSSEAFAAAHIPGALNLDVNKLSEKRNGVTGLVKPVEQLRKILGDAGVDPSKRVVVYSEMAKPDDLKDAARLFWVLDYVGYPRIAVLDGGLAKWKTESRKLEQGAASNKPIVLPELKVRPELLATAKSVEERMAKQDGILADFRTSDFYCGDKKADTVQAAGHIPGSVNVPAESFVTGDQTLKSWEELQKIAKAGGITGKQPVISYCNTGRTASTGYLVLRILGYDNVALYDGSMSDWTSNPEHKVDANPTK